jgi:hypothetical protein
MKTKSWVLPQRQYFQYFLLASATCVVNGRPAILPTTIYFLSFPRLQMFNQSCPIAANAGIEELNRIIFLVFRHFPWVVVISGDSGLLAFYVFFFQQI